MLNIHGELLRMLLVAQILMLPFNGTELMREQDSTVTIAV